MERVLEPGKPGESEDAVSHPYQADPHTPSPQRHIVPRAHPYRFSPGRSSVTPSPLRDVASPDLSPYPPLSEKQLKRLKAEAKKTQSQVELISDIIQRWTGEQPDHESVVACLADVLETKPDIRSFSALTSEDYALLNPGARGLISCNREQLHNQISHNSIPVDFWPALQTLRDTCSRRMEMGVRQIIGLFLAYAVKIARSHFENSQRLVVHSEVDVPVVDVPEIGRVKGPLDYLTCYAAGGAPMRKCPRQQWKLTRLEYLMGEEDGAFVMPSKPFFICVGAKRWQAFGIDASRAQLLAQIRALQISKYSN